MTDREQLMVLVSEATELHRLELGLIADYLIANGVTVQRWIPVTERLPKYFEQVLVNVPGDKPFTTVHEAHLRKDGLWDRGLYRYGKEDVTHWMHLPEPPKEVER